MRMRINRYLATCGVASRRAVEDIIRAGRVKIDGKLIRELGTSVDMSCDKVTLDGKALTPVYKKIYVLLNKPKGCVTTAKDEKGRRTIFDLVKIKERLFAVGRLDADSEGLLLLTNDGELGHRLMHPRYKQLKTYRVKLDRDFDSNDFGRLTAGMDLADGRTAPCHAHFYMDANDHVEIRLHEGKKRQIRRMFEALSYDVRALKRVQMGPLLLTGVQRGAWRFLTKGEIKQLRQAAGLANSA